MDSQMSSKINYMFMPTLKHVALVKLASTLCTQTDVKYFISEKNSYDYNKSVNDSQELINAIVRKVPELRIPTQLRNSLISYIQPVGCQIRNWIIFHVRCGYVTLAELPSEYFWTPQGTIDNKKVAETLVKDERLEIYVRFKLACLYCIEEYIHRLFNELPKGFYKKHLKEKLITYWSYYAAGEIDHMLRYHYATLGEGVSFWQAGFILSLASGNEVGTRFFFRRCTSDDRPTAILLLKYAMPTSYYGVHRVTGLTDYRFSNNLCYLLSEMDVGDQSELITICAYDLLNHLLSWPWQEFFLRTAKKKEASLCQNDYYSLLKTISKKMCIMPQEFNYQNLFSEFWQLSSTAYKRHVIMNEGLQSLIPALFSVGDKENIKLIFKVATVQEKEEFIFCRVGKLLCRSLSKVGDWKLLKFFIQECISSESFSELKLRHLFILISSDFHFSEIIHIWNGMYQILLDIEQENRKRCIDEV